MRRYLNLDTLDLQERADYAVPVTHLPGKRGVRLVLELQFVRDGTAELLPVGSTLLLGLKEKGKYDSDYVASAAFTVIAATADDFYICYCSTNTEEIAALLFKNADSADDVAAVTVMGEVRWIPGGIGLPLKSNTFDVLIANDVNRGDEVAADEAAPPYPEAAQVPRYLPSITALTGGAVGALDAIVTADGSASPCVIINVADAPRIWELVAGTDAEDAGGGIVRPDDYDGTTNPNVWKSIF